MGDNPGIGEADFRKGVDRLLAAGLPAKRSLADAWEPFAALRRRYAPRTYHLAYWTIAAPAPWSGERAGFPGLVEWPDAPEAWTLG